LQVIPVKKLTKVQINRQLSIVRFGITGIWKTKRPVCNRKIIFNSRVLFLTAGANNFFAGTIGKGLYLSIWNGIENSRI